MEGTAFSLAALGAVSLERAGLWLSVGFADDQLPGRAWSTGAGHGSLTSDGGQDLLGGFAQQSVAEDDGVFGGLGWVDDARRNGGGSHFVCVECALRRQGGRKWQKPIEAHRLGKTMSGRS